jgi:2,5-dihydroxypyridine 5,6-dioxygenase
VIAFPAANSVNGTLILQSGDVNLTFNRYLETPITLTIVNDHIEQIHGEGVDAALFESYLSVFGDRSAYATSHVGWGMNTNARWDTLALYDQSALWGTELRAFAGNFLYSTGANEHAGRFTAGHFDLPMRKCTVALLIGSNWKTVVDHGQLCPEMSPASPKKG